MTDKQLINKQHGTMTKRTQDEILARIKELEPKDFFGDQCSDLVQFLTFENAKPWLKEGVTSEQWQQLTDPVKCIRDYMKFAWGKANDCRGLSARRSVQHMQAWVWLDGKDELADRLEDVYEFYGKPCLVLVCQEYGIDWKELDNDSWVDYEDGPSITAEEALKRKGLFTSEPQKPCQPIVHWRSLQFNGGRPISQPVQFHGGRPISKPKQKPWVGLTDEEVSQLIDKVGFYSRTGLEHYEYTRAVEAKIKEKNR